MLLAETEGSYFLLYLQFSQPCTIFQPIAKSSSSHNFRCMYQETVFRMSDSSFLRIPHFLSEQFFHHRRTHAKKKGVLAQLNAPVTQFIHSYQMQAAGKRLRNRGSQSESGIIICSILDG
jgi:hypothetical protein